MYQCLFARVKVPPVASSRMALSSTWLSYCSGFRASWKGSQTKRESPHERRAVARTSSTTSSSSAKAHFVSGSRSAGMGLRVSHS